MNMTFFIIFENEMNMISLNYNCIKQERKRDK